MYEETGGHCFYKVCQESNENKVPTLKKGSVKAENWSRSLGVGCQIYVETVISSIQAMSEFR